MSEAAEHYVTALTHPQVNAVARALLAAIARLIPEGETTTPLISMTDLAQQTHVDRRTVWAWLPELVAIGEVRVVDGGQGRKARYTLVHVPGVAPIVDAALPLRADLQAVPKRRPVGEGTPNLFEESAPPTSPALVGSQGSQGSQVSKIVRITRITRITSWVARTITRITRITSWPRQRTPLVIRTCDPCDPAPPLDVDDARARDVHTLKEVHTHAAPSDEPAEQSNPPPPAIVRHPWHAWCGLVCVPKKLHHTWLEKGHTPAWLEAFYVRTCATMSPDQARLAVDEYKFWRAALAKALTPSVSGTRAAPPARAAPAPDLQARAVEERQRRQGSGFS